ncbi:minichromosome maintenance protein MCM [Candidatus Woesearchaeota archaeon]|nr:minichromosome maintenance protein MCM [Candidatus Woesearchaeota archaeon]
MDASEQIQSFQEFLETNYKVELLSTISKGLAFLVIDFSDLLRYNPELAELVIERPDEGIRGCEIAAEHFDLPEKLKNFRIRFTNLPESQKVLIRNIRSTHIGSFITVDGIVRQKSDVRPQVTAAKFECPSCGNIISVLQLDSKFKEPTRCGCGRKGKFRLVHKELVDAQGIVLEESPEDLEGGEQPKRMNILLKADLVSPISEKRTNPGSRILINGVIKEVPIISRTGSQSTRFDLLIEANYVEPVEEEFSTLEISEEELETIKEISRDPKLIDRLVSSIAPSIYGHTKIKEALLLQLASGVRKTRSDGVVTRGDLHVLLIGDPGSGKSQLLKRMDVVAPKSRYVSGKGASGAGLTAAVVKDEFLSGWSLEAGALVLANRGICMIDELDKMSTEDQSAMHEALEQQTITISKANIQATLRSETTVLAAANPKFGRFDPYGMIAEQIDLPPTLINRFDLIFPIRDLPDKDKDESMASFILRLHQKPDSIGAEIDTRTLRKYLAYARQLKPRLSDIALGELKDYYVKMRGSGSTEGDIKAIPISARQLEALVRLAEASAKIRLSGTVSREDAKRAIDLLQTCLAAVGVDPETGRIDIDRISTGVSASERSKIVGIKEIINEMERMLGKTIPVADVVQAALDRGMSEEAVEESIEKLKRSGDIFEPRKGFIQKI